MKKALFTILLTAAIMCILAISLSASVIYKNAEGTELFSCETGSDNIIGSTSGAFPKTDEMGNALIWYVSATATEGDDTVHTVKSFKTIGEEGDVKGILDQNGKYTVSGVSGNKIVSLNLPDNQGIKLIGIDFGGGYTGNFPKDSKILFAYLPNTLEETSANGGGGWTVQRLFQYTPILECYFSDLDTTNPNHLKTIGNFDFYGCRNMRVCKLPNGLTTIFGNSDHNSGPAFRECYSLREITIPNTVTSIGPKAFQDSGLEVIRFGANTSAVNADWAFNSGAHNLRYVYLPANDFSGQYLFNAGKSDMVFFYTGDFDDYTTLKSALSKNNQRFTNATPIEWDSTKDDQYYKNLATSENKCYVVYGYGVCEAFYGGHTWKGENGAVCEDYFSEIIIGDTCKECGAVDVKETIGPIFTWKGYSVSTFGETKGVAQGYYIDYQAMDAYLEYAPDLEYGFVAAINNTASAIAPRAGDAGVVSDALSSREANYLEIKISGISSDMTELLIVFCVYVIDKGNMYYLSDNATSSTVMGNSYNSLK